jgi:hypothetical protein
LSDDPIVDDGSLTGVRNACLNFFFFQRKGKDKSPSPWLFNDWIEWLRVNTFEFNSELDLRLRRTYLFSFAHWLLGEYPEMTIKKTNGKKLIYYPPGTVIY